MKIPDARYSAFCLGKIEYLLATRHASRRQPNDRANLIQTLSRTNWVRLQVLATDRGAADDDSGQVEFVATCHEDGTARQLGQPLAGALQAQGLSDLHPEPSAAFPLPGR